MNIFKQNSDLEVKGNLISGFNSEITSGITNTHIIGSNITATTSNTTYVNNLNISQSPTSGISENILVRESDGTIKYRSINDFSVSGGTQLERLDFYVTHYTDPTNLLISDPLSLSAHSKNNILTVKPKNQKAKATAPYLYEAFGHNQVNITGGTDYYNFYDNMLFEVIEVLSGTTNKITSDLQFSSHTGLTEYLTNNLEFSGVNVSNKFSVKMYANIDKSLQKIRKVRGINNFLSSLKGRGSYWRREIRSTAISAKAVPQNCMYASSLSDNWVGPNFKEDFFDVVYEEFLGINVSPYTGTTLDDVMSTIWFTPNPKKMYNLWPTTGVNTPGQHNPLSGSSITLPSSTGVRGVYDTSTSAFTNSSSIDTIVGSKIFVLDKVGTKFYYTNTEHLSSGLFESVNRGTTSINLNMPITSNAGTYSGSTILNGISSIRVYHLSNSGGTEHAFMVKPMGVDTILVDYIEDNTEAELYALFSSNVGDKQVVVKFDVNKSGFDSGGRDGNTGWRLQLDDYELFTLNDTKPRHNFIPLKYKYDFGRYYKNSFRNIRFFYGFPDGRISPLSDDEVYNIVNSSGCPLKRLVRKNPIN